MKGVKTIIDLNKLLEKIKKTNANILKFKIKNKKPLKKDVQFLKKSLDKLRGIKKEKNKFVLYTKQKDKIFFKLEYIIEELKKDIIFLEKGKKKLFDYFCSKDKNFKKQIKDGLNYLNKDIELFFSDRDGTLINYAETYDESIQAVYNALFITGFSFKIKKSVILSSGPLAEMKKTNIVPKKNIVYAGSLGREFYSKGKTKKIKFSRDQKKLIEKLKKEIKELLNIKKFKNFKLIGSGLQEKRGGITLAYQDINKSVSKRESEYFLKKVKEKIKGIDPKGRPASHRFRSC